ncbi:hypothetical protein LXL04_028182 [Taraxacum kok-saghyz]
MSLVKSVEQIRNRPDSMEINVQECSCIQVPVIEDILGTALIIDSIQIVHLMGATGNAGAPQEEIEIITTFLEEIIT